MDAKNRQIDPRKSMIEHYGRTTSLWKRWFDSFVKGKGVSFRKAKLKIEEEYVYE